MRPEKEIEVRFKEDEDDAWLLGMGLRYFKESSFGGFTFDPLAYLKGLKDAVWLVATHRDVIVGFISFFVTRQFTRETIGAMYLFYVAPEFRGTKTGRMLLENLDMAAKEYNIARMCVGSAAGISGKVDKVLENMFRRRGYNILGVSAQKDF